ncbi:unnamed protein product [[Candida] boidinii]|nr:unnamed protein product [[Candida] boidinii]
MAKYKDVLAKRANDERLAQNSVKLDQKSFVGFTFKHKNNPSSNPNNILTPAILNAQQSLQNYREYNVYTEPFGTLY